MGDLEDGTLCSFTMDYEESKILLNVFFDNRTIQIKLQESDVASMKTWFDLARLRNEQPDLFN